MCVRLKPSLMRLRRRRRGLVLFVASSVSGERVETIAKAILPFLAVEILVIFLIGSPAIKALRDYERQQREGRASLGAFSDGGGKVWGLRHAESG